MYVGIVSMRYAKALMAYVKEAGKEEAVYAFMKTLSHSFRHFPDLKVALENPLVPCKEKESLISNAAGCQNEDCKELQRFIKLILKNNREGFLQYICEDYITLYRDSMHIGVAKLTTAVPVSKEVESRIRENASTVLHAKMELLTCVDPSIEGGFIFDINDYRLDASIATQLKRVKQQFIDKNRRIV